MAHTLQGYRGGIGALGTSVRPLYATPQVPYLAWLLLLAPKLPTALPDEPWHTVQCAPHPPPAVISCPRIPWSRRGAGVPPRTPASVVRVRTVAQLIWRYCKMFFTESAARGLIDVIDVIAGFQSVTDTNRHEITAKDGMPQPADVPTHPARCIAARRSGGGGGLPMPQGGFPPTASLAR